MSRRRLHAYALIIAINDPPRVAYQGKPLLAPEHDAMRLRDTLISLGISPTSIDILSGRAATRQNIIDRLSNIATSPQIHKDTPILIYYAGMSVILVAAHNLIVPSRTRDTSPY